MKKQTFIVTLKLTEKIELDEDIKEIASNIGTAILRESGEYGITPENSEIMVESVTIQPMLYGYLPIKGNSITLERLNEE